MELTIIFLLVISLGVSHYLREKQSQHYHDLVLGILEDSNVAILNLRFRVEELEAEKETYGPRQPSLN